ncbi:ribosomal RNA small subunit methyltransferase E [Betaproteobacteria bacterium]|nr:ribosomal RNA small subunit methyltransferase E [Betaproteobacteria bacterium]GHU04503.1 ribosomal RNA small subunit methyltransferase E [Betaproteobacteria bacterium]GHU11592.1 ribosomal RNA small subunit methyltransferase E [Betaproteobacteria bacterium]GHU22524.1 ribosomal RNA small subunit methyltransferase E [Betaproteobacteria bacterium]
MSARFYFPGELPHQGEVELGSAAAHHALKVLRLAPGDPLVLFDGSGGELRARLDIRGRAAFAVDGLWQALSRESALNIVLVQALASGDKMDWVIQKAVELGAAGVIPVQAGRSVLKLGGERADKRILHWQQVIVAACEQCGRNRLPFVTPITTLTAYLDAAREVQRLILAPGGERLASVIAALQAESAPSAPLPLHLLVGPEGGWSEGELAQAVRAGCRPVGFGPRILRTETAGLAALAVVQAGWGDC